MAPSSNLKEDDFQRVKVAVVGAGAAGLMCAHRLLQTTKAVTNENNDGGGNEQIPLVMLLEARDRIGGRIHTTHDPVAGTNSSTRIYRDHGAAWVHGTGFDWPRYKHSATTILPSNNNENDNNSNENSTNIHEKRNPMMDLLQQSIPDDRSVCLHHLEPTFPLGNPWMRPGHVLVGSNQLVLFVAGGQVGGGDDSNKNKQEQDALIFQEALQHHHEIMKQVAGICNDMVNRGKINETTQWSLQDALDRVLPQQNIDGNQKDKTLVNLVSGFYRHLIECWHATSASSLQLLDFADDDGEGNENGELERALDEAYTDEGDFYGPHCTMKEGMEKVIQPLIENVSPHIHLNQPVVLISRKQSTKDTVCLEASTGMVVEADYCVVTVPQGCLAASLDNFLNDNATIEPGTICFNPKLSEEKISAIQHLDMGCYKKVFLTFDRIFWPRAQKFMGLVRRNCDNGKDGLGTCLLFDNLWAAKGIPCMEAVLIGNAGKWAAGKSDDAICDAVLQFLAETIGMSFEVELKLWCLDCHITRWEEDPYSRGAYSGYRLGTLPEHTEGLASAEWDGNLLFAGEATLSGDEGSVHAALISGEIAATKIRNAMKGAEIEMKAWGVKSPESDPTPKC